MRFAVPIRRHLVLGLQVVVGEHVQVGLAALAAACAAAGQLQAQGGDFGGAEVVFGRWERRSG